MEPNIELSKTRDFSEIISDSFLFIRQNFKPLLSCFFVFCGFFLLAGAIASILQQLKVAELVNGTDFNNGTVLTSKFSRFSNFGWEYFLTVLFSFITLTLIPVTMLSFMALYKAKGNIAPTTEEVWGYIKYYFLKVFGSNILNLIILIIATLFCLVPGIYLYPILGLMFPIMIVENTSYGYAFSQSFRLIKDNWWMTFGALFIAGLIAYICLALITVPLAAVNIWSTLFHQVKHVHLSIVSIVLGSVLAHVAHIFYILPLVTLGLCYFSLTESKDATGLMDRINQLGDNTPDTNAPAEEY
ncbi:MAG: hypothetical protein V4560_02365 [Bacteroidota bacterium]